MLFLNYSLTPFPKITTILDFVLMLYSFLLLSGVLLYELTTDYLSILLDGHMDCFSFRGIMSILVYLFTG